MSSSQGWRSVVAALGLVAAATGCAPPAPPKVGDPVGGGNVVVSNAFALEITGASVIPATVGNVTGNKVVVLFNVSQGGVLATTNQIAAAGVAFRFTAAALSPDPVAGGNLMAWKALLRNGSQTLVNNPIAGPGTPASPVDLVEHNVKQPGADSTGLVETLPDGTLRYTFANLLDASYDSNETLRVGGWLRGAVVAPDSAATFDFVPAGGAVTVRDTVLDGNCNNCHGFLQAHDGRHGVRLCLTCHTMQNADPDTVDPAAMSVMAGTNTTTATNPNPLDLGRMVHRIHRGKRLPTLYVASNNTMPAEPLPAAGNLPLPFLPTRNAPLLGRRYSIVGFRSTEVVFGEVVARTDNNNPARTVVEGVGFPRDLRDCAVCHGGAPQQDEQVNAISRRTCGGCHPDVWFGTGNTDVVHFAHTGGPQADDAHCAQCHVAPGGSAPYKLYADTRDVHVPLEQNPKYDQPQFDVVAVSNLVPGMAPTVSFRASDAAGTISPLNTNTLGPVSPMPRKMARVAITISGPTSDYRTGNFAAANVLPATESVPLTAVADGSGQFSYTFGNVLPASAGGTWAVAMEARRGPNAGQRYYDPATDTFPWPYTGESYYEAASNRVQYVDTATGAMWSSNAEPRRRVVDTGSCNRCHGWLSLHGSLRHDVEYCVMCHAPDQTDWGRRPKLTSGSNAGNTNLDTSSATVAATYDGIEERSVHLKVMVHRIHTGISTGVATLQAIDPLVIYGFGPTPIFLGDVEYPNRLADCTVCHVGTSYRIEAIPSTAAATLANEAGSIFHKATLAHQAGEPSTRPIAAACIGCHANGHAITHAAMYTSGTEEQCASCHGGTTGALSVDKAHGL